MSWHHPDLYLFLWLLTGLATCLAIVYECIQKFRRKPPVVMPLGGLQRDRRARPTEERASKRPSDFSRLCASIKDLPPKEQANRMRDYFGILGGAPRRAEIERASGYAGSHPARFKRLTTPGESFGPGRVARKTFGRDCQEVRSQTSQAADPSACLSSFNSFNRFLHGSRRSSSNGNCFGSIGPFPAASFRCISRSSQPIYWSSRATLSVANRLSSVERLRNDMAAVLRSDVSFLVGE
jgi:hypothetical protein